MKKMMSVKSVMAAAVLSLLVFMPVSAQEVGTDADQGVTVTSLEPDTLQAMSGELAQVKSRLGAVEQEQLYERIWRRKKFLKLGYANPSIDRTDGEPMTWKTDFSVFLQSGRTIYFHRKPVGGMLKFGLDVGMGIDYSKLKLDEAAMEASGGYDDYEDDYDDDMGINLGMHKIEYSLMVGPNVSFNPWNHLIISAYFHARPTASGIIENDNFSYGFGCAMAAGLSVSYKLISVGVEGLWSTIKYKQPSFDEDDEDDEPGLFTTKDFKLKQKAPRFYIAFRF